jgi:maltose O-acetyltransferase
MSSEMEKMLSGALYRYEGLELERAHRRACVWMDRYNAAHTQSCAELNVLLRGIMRTVGQGAFIKPPFYCDYGFNITLGEDAFLNFNCVILDQAPVTIGDLTRIGPGVQICTADHPRDAALRRDRWECAKPVSIGSNVWIGAGAQVLPGITIGDNAIVGAGSIVTRDVAKGATVAGNPATAFSRDSKQAGFRS